MDPRSTSWLRRVPTRPVVALCGVVLALAGCSASTSTATTTASTKSGSHSTTSPGSGTGTSAPTTTTVTLAQPTAAKPLTVMDVGDSLGEDLGIGEGIALGANPLVKVVQAAVGDTGLANSAYYDWPAHLKSLLAEYHPQVVTVLLGGNDHQNFAVNGAVIVFGTPQWHTIYSERVASMMSEAVAAGAKVVWVGAPIMAPATGLSPYMAELNSIYKAEAAHFSGHVFYLNSWPLLSNSSGQFATYLTDSQGQQVLARDSDGVHLATAGCEIVATAVASAIDQAWHITLSPGGATTTTSAAG